MRMLLLADIHIGVINDINYVYEVLTNIIDKEIIFKKTDAVIILGDYFHRLFKVNEDYVALAINVMSYLIRACRRNNTKIRMIYGTESHEMNQYRLFNYHVTSSDVDIKLITTVTEEEISPGVNVLYIPEEYILDKKKHYGKTLYSKKHYNYIFGHGVIDEGVPPMMAAAGRAAKNRKEKYIPHFQLTNFAPISDLCVFGHFHCYTDIGNGVYYLGSLFRSTFGEEIPKGYGVIEDGVFTFVENEEAYIYNTYYYKGNDPVFNGAEGITAAVQKIKDDNPDVIEGKKYGRFRMMFTVPDGTDPAFKDNVRNILRNEKMFTYSIKETLAGVQEEIAVEYGDEYDFVINDSITLADKVFRHIAIGHPESTLSLKDVQKYVDAVMK